MFNNILVVCVGNICRSPMAEALLARELKAGGASVGSAGLSALVNHPADEMAQTLMAEQDIDISAHRTRQLSRALIQQADLILVMEAGHKKAIEGMDPTARGKLYRLGEWRDMDIPDPYREPRQVFEQALELIQQGVADWISRLKP